MANLTPEACRAARALLEMSTRELGEKSGVAFETINKFENGRPMRESTKAKIVFVLESAGIEILNGHAPGARLRRGLIPDVPLLDAEREALLASLARQIDYLDALEDHGIDISKLRIDQESMTVEGLPLDLSGLSQEALRRLWEDPRVQAVDKEGK